MESIASSAVIQTSVMTSKPTQNFITIFFHICFVNYMVSVKIYEN